MRTRPDVMSLNAMVSTSSIYASRTGVKVLEDGGNIADAAIATSAVLAVTQNNLCGLGGDGFALLRMNGKIISINSSGKSSRNINAEMYGKKGMKSIPYMGPLAAITVPGLVGLWQELERHSSMDTKDLLKYAIKIAREGFPVTHNYARSIELTLRRTRDRNFRDTFSSNGLPPLQGDVFFQEDLASTIESLSKDGLDSFYKGNFADKLLKAFQKSEVVVDETDLSKHKPKVQDPLKSFYEDRIIYELPPNSQGATVNFNLNSLRFMKDDDLSYEEKIMKSHLIANKFRRTFIGDPDRMPLPSNYLDEAFYWKVVDSSESGKSASGKDGDTTYFTIANTDGDAISIIQSNYTGFGSTVVPEGTGFSLQNRGSYFSLDPAHHNYLEPEKRTFHTLCAGMIERNGEFEYSIGTMGGDIQPQVHVNKIHELIDLGMTPQEAIDLPRINIPANIYEDPDLLIFEEGASFNYDLSKYFKRIRQTSFLDSSHGHCQIIKRGENGVLFGGADPRGDGFALSPLF